MSLDAVEEQQMIGHRCALQMLDVNGMFYFEDFKMTSLKCKIIKIIKRVL
jgi:hypothetical protein